MKLLTTTIGCALATCCTAGLAMGRSPLPIDPPTPPPCAADGTCYPNTGEWGYYPSRWRPWPGDQLVPTPSDAEPTPAEQESQPRVRSHRDTAGGIGRRHSPRRRRRNAKSPRQLRRSRRRSCPRNKRRHEPAERAAAGRGNTAGRAAVGSDQRLRSATGTSASLSARRHGAAARQATAGSRPPTVQRRGTPRVSAGRSAARAPPGRCAVARRCKSGEPVIDCAVLAG